MISILVLAGCGGGSSSSTPETPAPTLPADTTAPVIMLFGEETIELAEGSAYTEPGAEATDNVDGDVAVEITGTVSSEPGEYILTYTATDAAGNENSITRKVIVSEIQEPATLLVYTNGHLDETWNLGLNAFDEAINFSLCSNDQGDGCPNISWDLVNDPERGMVLEIAHSSAGSITGFFVKTSTPLDLRDFTGGTLEFDAKIISGDPNLTLKIDCIFPCTSGDFDLGIVSNTGWQTIVVPIDDLVAQDLDLSQIDTGLVIWATGFTDTVFRLDNILWRADPNGTITDPEENGSVNETWTNPNLTGPVSPLSYDGYTLLWSDEFEGSALNPMHWNYETGTGENGWGNNELQYYLAENVRVVDSLLVIQAKKENVANRAYTSARITTEDKFSFKYGRVDIRAAMPRGQGMWPALWMLGQNFKTVGWPESGEIDIMEMIGGSNREDTVHATAHWNHTGSRAQFGGSYQLSNGQTLADGFHVFSLVWTEDVLEWYIDAEPEPYHTLKIDLTESEGLEAFRRAFFFIANVAVGGDWPGDPNANTRFPQYMLVDYIRVFEPN